MYVIVACVYNLCLFQDNCPTVHNPNQTLEACTVNGTQGNNLSYMQYRYVHIHIDGSMVAI